MCSWLSAAFFSADNWLSAAFFAGDNRLSADLIFILQTLLAKRFQAYINFRQLFKIFLLKK